MGLTLTSRSQRPAANSLSCWRCTYTHVILRQSKAAIWQESHPTQDVSASLSLLPAQMLSSCWLLMLCKARAKQSRSHHRVDPFVDPRDQAALIINPRASLSTCVYTHTRSAMELHSERCFNWRVCHL